MRLLKRSAGTCLFHLGEEEKGLLLEVIGLYPVLEPSFQPLSKSSDPARRKADQRLLEEALASQKEENAQTIRKTFGEGKCFSKSGPAWRMALTDAQAETLLQVLNDIRVGSWQNLGCPDPEQERRLHGTKATRRSLFLMEISAFFQTNLLRALDHDAGAD